MKEIQKHRVGEIVYHKNANLYLVIADVIYSIDSGCTYYLKYADRRYNPLGSHYAGGYSEIVFGDIFEMCLNV